VGIGVVPSIPSGQASPVSLCNRPPGRPGRSVRVVPALQATPRSRGAGHSRRR
jgi:hypothetical protein